MAYISPAEIKKACGRCSKSEARTSQAGNRYYYCNKYHSPCFKVLKQCRKDAYEDEQRALDLMEAGISEAETSYEPDAHGPRGGWF